MTVAVKGRGREQRRAVFSPVHGACRAAVVGPPFTAGDAGPTDRKPRSRGFSLFGFSRMDDNSDAGRNRTGSDRTSRVGQLTVSHLSRTARSPLNGAEEGRLGDRPKTRRVQVTVQGFPHTPRHAVPRRDASSTAPPSALCVVGEKEALPTGSRLAAERPKSIASRSDATRRTKVRPPGLLLSPYRVQLIY